MNASAFRDLWALVPINHEMHSRSYDFSNCTRLRLVQFENFQNTTSDYKSRNARAGSYDFLVIIFSTKLLKRATLFVLVFLFKV